ncbi:MAG TPA: biotin/lipoyl-containing protein [Thermoanaerobaculia bacterium]|nr:biotin/lipoyl-containing protein [Thermoanaerobaculia bacterium]
MELIVTTGGQSRRIKIERRDGGYELEIEGRRVGVQASRAGGLLRSLLYDGQHWEVAVRSHGEGAFSISTRGRQSTAEVADPLTHLARESRGGSRGQGQGLVKALMPGRAVAVLAEEGAEVRAGQGIVVLEAMKMENEIRAERDGVVKRLFVVAGQAVEGGDPLFEIGDSPAPSTP